MTVLVITALGRLIMYKHGFKTALYYCFRNNFTEICLAFKNTVEKRLWIIGYET